MTYVKKIELTIFLSIGLFLNSFSQYKEIENVISIKENPLVEQIITNKFKNLNIHIPEPLKIIDLAGTPFSANAQELVVTDRDMYIFIQQTGFFYKLTDTSSGNYTFLRQDRTININYNIGAATIIHKNKIFSYGGYGFWKSNGQLRKFNQNDQEWDIIPVNKEIFLGSFSFYSIQQGRFYLPYQSNINAGLRGAENLLGKKEYTSQYLDMDKNEWVALGVVNKNSISLFEKLHQSTFVINYKNGQLSMANDIVYYLDFLNNKIYKSKNDNLNQYFVRRSANFIHFSVDSTIYSYTANYSIVNNVKIDQKDFELLDFPIWEQDKLFFYYLGGILSFILTIILIILFLNRKIQRKIQKAQLKVLKTKSIHQAFSLTEISLIRLLIRCSEGNRNTEIHEINHVLGIKDKNIGLQKKVRSDNINGINEKYMFITQSESPLINSIRKEDDKRFFEYYISPSEISQIKKIIGEE